MSGTNVVSGLKEPPLPLSQEGLGQQTSPNEGQAKRERVSGHKGPLLLGRRGGTLGIQLAWGGCSGQTAGQLDRRADGQEKSAAWSQCVSDMSPGGVSESLGEHL